MITEFPWDTPCTPGGDEWQRRLDWAMAQPDDGWWWLSFVDPGRPEGDRFLGVAIVPGGNVIQASQFAWTLGINPGGQVAGFPLPSTPRLKYVGILHAGADGRHLGELEPADLFEPGT